jgi:hypothetical protein
MISAQYPYWLMIAGGLLAAFGFIGIAFKQNRMETRLDDERVNGSLGAEAKQESPGPSAAKVRWSLPPPEL